MTEEITYANLKFENSHELDNITQPEDTKEKGVVSVKLLWFIPAKVNGPENTFNYALEGPLLALYYQKNYKYILGFDAVISAWTF